MKTIPMSNLQPGDIFAFEIKLRNREAFEVVEKDDMIIKCTSRNDFSPEQKTRSKRIHGWVYLLRNKD